MNVLPANDWEELDRLIDGACDQTLSTAEMKTLSRRLVSDPKACDRYIAHMAVHRQLAWRLMPTRPFSPEELDRYARADRESPDAESDRESAVPFGILAAPVRFDSVPTGAFGYFASGWPVAYLIATVILGVGLIAAAVVHVSQPMNVVQKPVSLPSHLSTLPSAVARITGMVDCVWNNDECRMLNAELRTPKTDIQHSSIITQHFLLHLGDTLALRSGLLEITYDTGAKLILQGPVTYEIDAASGGHLAVGRLTAALNQKSEVGGRRSDPENQKSEIINQKFAVRTPTALVTDLGTEFGVEVTKEGATDTHVFVGRVRVESLDAQGIHRQSRMLQAGQSARVGTDLVLATGLSGAPDRAEHFVRTMPAIRDPGDAYAELVLSMDPVVYYRMDRWPAVDTQNHCVLIDSAPGGHHGEVLFDKTFGLPCAKGKFGGALPLHGMIGNEYVLVKDYPKPQNGRLAASAWVLPFSVQPWIGIVSNWYHPLTNESSLKDVGQFSLCLGQQSELTAQVRQRNGELAIVREAGLPLATNHWQHVAFVADGTMLRLYHDGVEVDAVPCDGVAPELVRKCLSIGGAINRAGTGARPEEAFLWNGRIDELAVFNHALSADQVRRLYSGQSALGAEEQPAHAVPAASPAR